MTDRLNATAASLLGFLHDGPMTGWDLVARAQERIGDFWTLTRSQVYRELAAMAAVGFVEAGERGQRDRRPYAITEAGRKAFIAWVHEMPGVESIRFPLLLRMVFAEHVSTDRMAEFVAWHRRVHAERLVGYEQAWAETGAGTAPGYRASTLAFGIAYERAVLAWFDGLPAAPGT
jgi:DNA-binding PadR family transcriptional regulator